MMLARFAAVAALVAVAALPACRTVQTTSGEVYLSRYDMPVTVPTDIAVRQAAAVEPLLTFPARIGLARIDHGALSPIPSVEADAWERLAQRLGPSVGEFVPVSPLVAKLVSESFPSAASRNSYEDRLERVLREIRLGAARQHLDAVLIYEVYGHEITRTTPLSFADLTIIGAYILPSQSLEAKSYATALLIDVRNGYPYGFTDTIIKEESGFAPLVNSSDRVAEMARQAKSEAAIKLVDEIEPMVLELRAKLAEKRLHKAAVPSAANAK